MPDSQDADWRNDLKNGDEATRRIAARSLAAMEGRRSLDVLLDALGDPSRAVRETVVDALSALPPADTAQALIGLLGDERSEVRNIVIEALEKIGRRAVNVLIDAIDHPFDDPDIEMFLVDILGEIGDPVAVGVIIPRLSHVHPNVRNAAVVALGKMGSPATVPMLRDLLRDEDWICFSAIESLAKIGGLEAEQALLDMLEKDRGDLFDTACLEGLSTSRNMALVPDLLNVIIRRPPGTAQRFVETLRMILDGRVYDGPEDRMEDVRGWLRDVAFGEDAWCAFQAVEVIELIGDAVFTDLLGELVGEGNPELVRFAAIRALGTIGDPVPARNILKTISDDYDATGNLKDVLDEAMQRLNER